MSAVTGWRIAAFAGWLSYGVAMVALLPAHLHKAPVPVCPSASAPSPVPPASVSTWASSSAAGHAALADAGIAEPVQKRTAAELAEAVVGHWVAAGKAGQAKEQVTFAPPRAPEGRKTPYSVVLTLPHDKAGVLACEFTDKDPPPRGSLTWSYRAWCGPDHTPSRLGLSLDEGELLVSLMVDGQWRVRALSLMESP